MGFGADLFVYIRSQMSTFFMHDGFHWNNLIVSYLSVISEHFHLMVTIIKHINVFLISYYQYL